MGSLEENTRRRKSHSPRTSPSSSGPPSSEPWPRIHTTGSRAYRNSNSPWIPAGRTVSSYSDRLASVVQTNSTSGSPDTATPDTRPLLAGPNTQGLGLFLLLAPVRLIYHLINKSARILTRMVINLARIPLRMIEWGIHIVIFVVMVIIFFTILHLLFKIPFVLLGIS